MTRFDTILHSAGMNSTDSAVKESLLAELMRELRAQHPRFFDQHLAFFIPGRIEVLGKHTDYAGGRSLVCAIERGICVVAAPRDDARVHVTDAGRKLEAWLDLDPEQPMTSGHWSNYAATVTRRLARDFPSARTGAEIIFASDLPRASGMSSSSALVVGIFSALAEINYLSQNESFYGRIRSLEDLAAYLASVENGTDFASFSGDHGVGTLGGSEDHTAILCSHGGFLRQYSFCPTRLEKEIRMPEQHVFVIGVSGVKADKTGNARDSYNRTSLMTRKILALWQKAAQREDVSLGAALSSDVSARERLFQIVRESKDSAFSPDLLVKRLIQFTEETLEIIPAAADAIGRGDLPSFGIFVDRSELLAETLLGNQVPETIELARSARTLGAVAASAFGAGFGGSVWALLSSTEADEFRETWAANYRRKFPDFSEASEFFISGAGQGLIQFDSSK